MNKINDIKNKLASKMSKLNPLKPKVANAQVPDKSDYTPYTTDSGVKYSIKKGRPLTDTEWGSRDRRNSSGYTASIDTDFGNFLDTTGQGKPGYAPKAKLNGPQMSDIRSDYKKRGYNPDFTSVGH